MATAMQDGEIEFPDIGAWCVFRGPMSGIQLSAPVTGALSAGPLYDKWGDYVAAARFEGGQVVAVKRLPLLTAGDCLDAGGWQNTPMGSDFEVVYLDWSRP